MWPLWFVILSEFKIEQRLEYDMTYVAPLMPVGEPNVFLVLFFFSWQNYWQWTKIHFYLKLNLAQVGERKKEAFQEILFFYHLSFVHSLFTGVKRGETKSLFTVVDHDRVCTALKMRWMMLFFWHFVSCLLRNVFAVFSHIHNDSCECVKARPLAAKRRWYHSEQAGQRHLFRAGTVASLSAWDSGVERTLWDKGLNSNHIQAKSLVHCVADTIFPQLF